MSHDQKVTKIKLKKGDTVMIRSGKFKGKTGKIINTHPSENKVTVEGINIVKRHRKPTRLRPQGGIDQITKPIWVSKVGILDSAKKKPSKIGYTMTKDGTKKRVIKSSSKEIAK